MLAYIEKNKDSIFKVSLFIIAIILVYIIIKYLFAYIAPFFVGWLISLCLNPLFVLLNKRFKLTANIAVFISLIVFFFLIVLIGNYIVVKIISEGKDFVSNIPVFIEQASDRIEKLQIHLSNFAEFIPEELNSTINIIIQNLIDFAKNKSINIMTALPATLMFLIVTVISAFFFTKDKNKINEFVFNQIPTSWKKTLTIVCKGLLSAFGGYFKAQLMLMLVTSIISVIGLFVLGYSYALFIGLMISVIDAVPVFGSGFILWPWALYNILLGNYKRAVGLIVIYLIILLSRQSLEPKLIGKQIGIHPLLTLMSIFIGLKIFGLFGFIIGPLIIVTVKSLQESKLLPNWKNYGV